MILKTNNNWHSLSTSEVMAKLKTGKNGLSGEEAQKRLKKFGPNELPREKKTTAFKIFLEQFKGPLIVVLLIAAIISISMAEFIDFGIIMAAVLLNTVIGFTQEYKANRSLQSLKKMIEPRASVRRDGREMTIPSHLVVPGDIILIESGSRVAADGRIVESYDFSSNEAALTGESFPVKKFDKILNEGKVLAERINMVYFSTVAVRGRAVAVVTATGRHTEVGEIARLIREIPEAKTPLQQKLHHFGKLLGAAVAIMSFLVFMLGILLGESVFDMFLMGVALAVAAIPEGLLVAVTIILAIGMQKILKKKALTRKLIAAETLGSVSVICSDKTGTLTEGEMQVTVVETCAGPFEFTAQKEAGQQFAKSDHALALKIGLLCNDAHFEDPSNFATSPIVGDPTDRALFRAARESGMDISATKSDYPRKQEIPFESSNRYMATRHKFNRELDVIYIKGAPEKILSYCGSYLDEGEIKEMHKADRERIFEHFEELTGKGLRVLATAYRRYDRKDKELTVEDLKEMTFVAFFGLQDPVRPDVRGTIEECRAAGIRPVMVTGDHMLTAVSVAKQVGIEVKKNNTLNGAEIDKMTDRELEKIIKKVDVFSRVEPHHKVRIVDAWQKTGAVVAMTGDGVNDAPALKAADVGVALGSGTDVAKENSDLVLLNNHYQTIVDAVQQGRVIFDNIRKVIVYLLSDSFSEMILIVGALLLRLPLPILPAQILWINLVTDGLPDMALTLEPGEKDVMKLPPRKRTEPLLNREMKAIIFIIGLITDLGLLGLFYYFISSGTDLVFARTVIFAALGLDSLLYVFSCRSLRHTIFTMNPFSNRWLVLAVVGGLGLQLIALYVPFFQNVFNLTTLGMSDWILVGSIGIIKLIGIEFTKTLFITYWRRKHLVPKTA